MAIEPGGAIPLRQMDNHLIDRQADIPDERCQGTTLAVQWMTPFPSCSLCVCVCAL